MSHREHLFIAERWSHFYDSFAKHYFRRLFMVKYVVLTCLVLFSVTGCSFSKRTQTITLKCGDKTLVEKTFESYEDCRAFAREADYSCNGVQMDIECN